VAGWCWKTVTIEPTFERYISSSYIWRIISDDCSGFLSSLQPLPRIGWNSGNSGQGGLNSISTDEVSRMFMPRKSAQRSNSSSTITSSTPTITAPSPQINGGPPTANGELGGGVSRKKPAKGLWPSSKAEPVSGITPARPQLLTSPSPGTPQAATMSAVHQPSPILPSQHNAQPQQSGGRGASGQLQGESPAVLVLLPMNGTFERKQINVPFFLRCCGSVDRQIRKRCLHRRTGILTPKSSQGNTRKCGRIEMVRYGSAMSSRLMELS
jgi:hypothetical protein